MVGCVNKGSNKFKKLFEKSPNLDLLYNELNNEDFFIEMKNKLDVLNCQMEPRHKNFNLFQKLW